MLNKPFNIDEFQVYAPDQVALSKMMTDLWVNLGKPTDVFSEAGQKMLGFIIKAWEEMRPREALEWKRDRDEHLGAELSIKEQIQQKTGRVLASYPGFVYHLAKRIFTDTKFSERNTVIKLVQLFPIFRYVNKV